MGISGYSCWDLSTTRELQLQLVKIPGISPMAIGMRQLSLKGVYIRVPIIQSQFKISILVEVSPHLYKFWQQAALIMLLMIIYYG